jgi:GntR family transcriptional regulator
MVYTLSDLPDLDESSYIPLNVQLSETLTNFIESQNLKSGDSFPSESELIDRFGVSRMTVRGALTRLAAQGLIHKIQGRGTFVAEPKLTQRISDFESFESDLAKKGIKIVSIPVELTKIRPMPIWIDNLGLPKAAEVVKTSRLKKIADRAVALEHVFLTLDIADRFSTDALKSEPVIDLFRTLTDTKINRILHVTRCHIIFEFDAELLDISHDAPVLTRRFTYFNKINRPIATGRITYVADWVELEVELFKENGKQERIKLKE